jgi:ankyrin repeat protein
MNFEELFPDKESIENYILQNKPLNIVDSETNRSLIMFVCFNNYEDLALKLLTYRPEEIILDLVDNYDQTALKYACIRSMNSVALKMLDFDAEAVNLSYFSENSQYNNGTALVISCSVEDMKDVALKILVFTPEEVNINAYDANRSTALMNSCVNGLEDIAIKILEYGSDYVDISKYDITGNTAFMYALEYKLVNVVNKMLDDYPDEDLNLFILNSNNESAKMIAEKQGLTEIKTRITNIERRLIRQMESEYIEVPGFERNNEIYYHPNDIISHNNSEEEDNSEFYNGTIPDIDYKPEQIDVNKEGWDPIMAEELIIKDYLEQNKEDNIAILYKNKVFLITRSVFEYQRDFSTVFECLEVNNVVKSNIVHNLPLYNLRTIGLVSIDVNYIYSESIDKIINNVDNSQLYNIIPIPDKKIVSVITLNDVENLISGNIHNSYCKTSEGGFVGLIVPTKQSEKGGFLRNKNKTLKNKKNKRKTIKKNLQKKHSKTVKKII